LKTFLLEQDEKLFILANSVWQMANKFGEKCTNFNLTFGVLFVGEIDQNFFCAPATFLLGKKVW
jgi:hypothetical protein